MLGPPSPARRRGTHGAALTAATAAVTARATRTLARWGLRAGSSLAGWAQV